MSETCEIDPITWNAMVGAMVKHGVADETIGKICGDTLVAVNATPVAVRDQLNAQAKANFAARQRGEPQL
jgi:hypothetical protein